MYEIIFYKNAKGESEIQEYLEKLRNKTDKNSKVNFAKINACIELLKKYGTVVLQYVWNKNKL